LNYLFIFAKKQKQTSTEQFFERVCFQTSKIFHPFLLSILIEPSKQTKITGLASEMNSSCKTVPYKKYIHSRVSGGFEAVTVKVIRKVIEFS